MTFAKVRTGDPLRISADNWNLLADMANAFGRSQGAFLASPSRGLLNPSVALIRNDSGSDLDRFEVLGITGVIINRNDNEEQFESNFAFTGDTPDIDDHSAGFAVVQEPISDGDIGLCVVNGLTPVRVDMNASTDLWAEVKDNDRTELDSSSDSGSARIVYKESGTGTRWAVANLGFGAAPTKAKGIWSNHITSAYSGTDPILFTDDLIDSSDNFSQSAGVITFKKAGWYEIVLIYAAIWTAPSAGAPIRVDAHIASVVTNDSPAETHSTEYEDVAPNSGDVLRPHGVVKTIVQADENDTTNGIIDVVTGAPVSAIKYGFSVVEI